MAKLVSASVDFRAKKISISKGIQALYKEKRVNSAGYMHIKYVYIKQHNLKILEAKIGTSSEYSYKL